MATLTNTQISVTYVGLLKTSANTVLSSTAQQITDGSGNNSIYFYLQQVLVLVVQQQVVKN
jgi:hypothetical protein